MVHEPGPHGVLPVAEFPAGSRVSPLCRSVRRRCATARLLLLGSVLSMAFAQLTYRDGLRDIEACLRSLGGKLYVTVQIPMVVDFRGGGGWARAGAGDGNEPQSVNSREAAAAEACRSASR